MFAPANFPQYLFFTTTAFEVLFGGLPYAGKSLCLVILALMQVWHPKYTGWIFRRNDDDLQALVDFAYQYYPEAGGVATERGRLWTFPSGAWIRFSHMADSRSWTRIRGHNNAFLGFDEINEFEEEQYGMSRVWCRPAADDLIPMVRCTANPDGPGRGWVGRHFIRNREPFEIHEVTTAMGSTTLQFIPTGFRDLTDTGIIDVKAYEASLHLIPNKHIREAFLAKDPLDAWKIVIGQFFDYNSKAHVVPSSEEAAMRQYLLEVPRTVIESIDYGSRDYFSYHVYVRDDTSGTIYATDEHHEKGKDLVMHHIPKIKNIRRNKLYRGKILSTMCCRAAFADHSGMRSQQTGAQILRRHGINVQPAFDGGYDKRINGWAAIQRMMAHDEFTEPMLKFFESCEALNEDVSGAVADADNPEELDKSSRDHTLDDLRYAVMKFDADYLEPVSIGHIPEPMHTREGIIDFLNGSSDEEYIKWMLQ